VLTEALSLEIEKESHVRQKTILITGASGEVGHALIKHLMKTSELDLLTIDINPLPEDLQAEVPYLQGDITDRNLFSRLVAQYEFDQIYHLAALLSTRAEFTPETAHRVNVQGTMSLLQMAAEQSQWRGKPVLFIFPSSIAAYGVPDLETKSRYSKVREWEWNYPSTMYGCNKLYGEMLGNYFSRYYRQLSAEENIKLDFRSVRFPGLISAFTVPSGGTSDYASEMIHAAAQDKPYACFVREDVKIPFMAMPDAVKSLVDLAAAPRDRLHHAVYNVTAFSLSAGDIHKLVRRTFPNAQVTFEPDLKRQDIVDTWPEDLDDSAARRDWDWAPEFDAEKAFKEYLIPNIQARYHKIANV